MATAKFLDLPIFCTGKMMRVEIERVINRTKSDFQELIVADSKKFGRCLIIDGVMQCATSDHKLYDRELLKMLKKTDRKILILGGGDGYVAKMVLEKNSDAEIRIVDLDALVIHVCEKFLNKKIFKNNRVKLSIEDALYFLKFTALEVNGEYDGIICDLTDAPIGRRKKKDFENFFKNIIKSSHKLIKNGGWISVQGGASNATAGYIDAAKVIKSMLENDFLAVERSDIFIPSYGESCAFLFGRKNSI